MVVVPLPFDPIFEARRNWDAHKWGATNQMATATAITRAHQILLRRIDNALEPLGLTFSRFEALALLWFCLLYTSPSPRDYAASRMPSSA